VKLFLREPLNLNIKIIEEDAMEIVQKKTLQSPGGHCSVFFLHGFKKFRDCPAILIRKKPG
jgi:hypothetical protein